MNRRMHSLPSMLFFALVMFSTPAEAKLFLAPHPTDMPTAPIDVQIRHAASDTSQRLFVYRADSMAKRPHEFGGSEGFVAFAFTGEVELRITFPTPVHHATVRPSLREAVPVQITGRTVTFRLPRPRYVALEIDQSAADAGPAPRHTLYILADAPELNPPRPDDPSVKLLSAGHHAPDDFDPREKATVYLAAGIHTVAGNVAPLHSKKTLYLAPGAILRAKLIGDNVHDVRLLGRGILDGSFIPREPGDFRSEGEQGFLFLRRGTRILIDGPIIYNAPYWNIVAFGTSHLTIRNHKAITWKVNNDGIQPRSCTDLLVENCFLKCADDCIAVKTRRAAAMESRRLVFRNLVLWNDIPGNAMEIGHTSQADLLEDVTFRDIEVIHCDGRAHAISMTIIDHSTVRNVLYENIYVEGTKSKDIGLRITTSGYSTDDRRGHIDGVTIRNYFTDDAPRGGQITGFAPDHLIENVTIQNFVIHAHDPARRQAVPTLDALNLKLQHTRNVRLLP